MPAAFLIGLDLQKALGDGTATGLLLYRFSECRSRTSIVVTIRIFSATRWALLH
jgi:hypothetical protein